MKKEEDIIENINKHMSGVNKFLFEGAEEKCNKYVKDVIMEFRQKSFEDRGKKNLLEYLLGSDLDVYKFDKKDVKYRETLSESKCKDCNNSFIKCNKLMCEKVSGPIETNATCKCFKK